MAEDKKTKLSIILSTVDQATAKIKAVNDRLDKITKPTRDFKKALSDLSEKSGLDGLSDRFKGVGTAVEGLLSKLAIIGGVAGLAVHGLFGLVAQFDDLGDKAERLGVSVDFLASMRYAAEKAGAPVEALDNGLQAFSQNVGQLRANTGRLYSFLGKVSPALLEQVKAAKSNEDAFDLMAAAIAKVSDPAKRAALAQKAFGDSALAPLLAKGAVGVKELRDRYIKLAGSQQGAADAAGKTDDALHDLHAATDGVKAALVEGLAPALTIIVNRLRDWFAGHRADVAAWAKNIGEKLPAAFQAVAEWLGKAYDKVKGFVGAIGGLQGVAIAAGLVLVGPLVASLATLAVSLGTVLSRVTDVGKALEAGGGKAAGFGTALKGLTAIGGAFAIAEGLNQATGGPIEGGPLAMAKRFIDAQKKQQDVADQARAAANPEAAAAAQAAAAAVAAAFSGRPPPDSKAKITIDMTGVARGTKVRTDPQNTADVDLSVGYSMLAVP